MNLWGPACTWAQALHDIVFYYNDIIDLVSDIALGEAMNLFVQAHDTRRETVLWLANAMATLDYVGSVGCKGCAYHSDSEDWFYGACLWYLAATRYRVAPQFWSAREKGGVAPRWQDLSWRHFTLGWSASRWPYSETWDIASSPVDYDLVRHLALRLGVHGNSEAEDKIRSIVSTKSSVPEIVRAFILLGFPDKKYTQCIEETVFSFLKAYGCGTGSYSLEDACVDGVAYNLAHANLLDKFFSQLDGTQRSSAVRTYCGLVSAICELTDLDVFGRIAEYSATAVAAEAK